jgi:hypothetical protein
MYNQTIPHEAGKGKSEPPSRTHDCTRRVQLARYTANDGCTYQAILIREPLSQDDIELIGNFLELLESGAGRRHVTVARRG